MIFVGEVIYFWVCVIVDVIILSNIYFKGLLVGNFDWDCLIVFIVGI